MKTTPLPPVHEDPAFTRASQIGTDLTTQLAAIRGDVNLSALAKARQVTAAYEAAIAERSALWADLQSRRQARLAELQTLLPFGPGIAPNTSPADAAVLQSAFRANVERARSASMRELHTMLADALRFGDELARRAVYTVATDQGREGVVWSDLRAADPELASVAEEIGQLTAQLTGTDPLATMWHQRAWWTIQRPEEVLALPTLEASAARAGIVSNGTNQ